ncbi:MAG: glycosyltransferase family 4 protein [Steroidobacteraceae bacterium]
MIGSRDTAPRVLFVCTEVFSNGGIQRFNQTLLDACNRLGISCRVLSLKDSPASIAKHPTRSHESIMGFSGDWRRFALAVTGAVLRDRYDRVLIGHINLLTLVNAALALRPFRRAPRMLIAHGIEVWSGINAARRYAMSRADRILCVSHYTRQRILEQAPALLAQRLIIFPNALATTWDHIIPVPSAHPVPTRFILSVTRLERGDRYKGITTVIEAFSMLADDSMQYLVIGDGDDLPFLRLVAERCGVKDRVHFMRSVSDSELIALYQTCEAFVLPSGKEGFGIVFLEAMFFGAPVIAARENGAVDVVRDGETGISVRFGDTIAIKEAIERIGTDNALRERLRANGRSMVTAGGPFTFARFTQRCAEVFELGETITA